MIRVSAARWRRRSRRPTEGGREGGQAMKRRCRILEPRGGGLQRGSISSDLISRETLSGVYSNHAIRAGSGLQAPPGARMPQAHGPRKGGDWLRLTEPKALLRSFYLKASMSGLGSNTKSSKAVKGKTLLCMKSQSNVASARLPLVKGYRPWSCYP